MLCHVYDYKLELEDTIGGTGNNSYTSPTSRADYVCYILKKTTEGTVLADGVPMIVVETKHLAKLSDKAIAQTLGYYYKSQGSTIINRPGAAILFNGYRNGVEIVLFLFPYFNAEKGAYGTQCLKLTPYRCTTEQYVQNDCIELLLQTVLMRFNYNVK